MLPRSGPDAGSLKVIFHEYAHLLLRHSQPYWPMWLTEGMAEIYATFDVRGGAQASIGHPIGHHLRLLAQKPLLPLRKLFAVTRDSPEYNEREHQGIFYSEVRNIFCSPAARRCTRSTRRRRRTSGPSSKSRWR